MKDMSEVIKQMADKFAKQNPRDADYSIEFLQKAVKAQQGIFLGPEEMQVFIRYLTDYDLPLETIKKQLSVHKENKPSEAKE